MAKIRVILKGPLAARFGEVHWFEAWAVRTPADAIRALQANYGGFRDYLQALSLAGWNYRVTHPQAHQGISETEINKEAEQHIAIAPVYGMASDVGRLVGGAALIVGSFFTGGLLSTALLGIGAALALGAVTEIFTPSPTSNRDEEEQRRNRNFSSATAQSVRDSPIPLLIGQMRIENPPVFSSAIIASRNPDGQTITSVDPAQTSRGLSSSVGGYRTTLHAG